MGLHGVYMGLYGVYMGLYRFWMEPDFLYDATSYIHDVYIIPHHTGTDLRTLCSDGVYMGLHGVYMGLDGFTSICEMHRCFAWACPDGSQTCMQALYGGLDDYGTVGPRACRHAIAIQRGRGAW